MRMVMGLFSGLFVAVGIGMLIHFSVKAGKAMEITSWPTTNGEILSSEVRTNSDSDGDTYETQITYQYELNGETYYGASIHPNYSSTSDRNDHEKISSELHQGRRVVVHYNLHNPREAFLAGGMNRFTLMGFVFSVIWIGFSVGVFVITAFGASDSLIKTIKFLN